MFFPKYLKSTLYLILSHVLFRMSSNENKTVACWESSPHCIQRTRFAWVITWYFTTVKNRLLSNLGTTTTCLYRKYKSNDLLPWYSIAQGYFHQEHSMLAAAKDKWSHAYCTLQTWQVARIIYIQGQTSNYPIIYICTRIIMIHFALLGMFDSKIDSEQY